MTIGKRIAIVFASTVVVSIGAGVFSSESLHRIRSVSTMLSEQSLTATADNARNAAGSITTDDGSKVKTLSPNSVANHAARPVDQKLAA